MAFEEENLREYIYNSEGSSEKGWLEEEINQDLIKPGRSLARNIRLTTRNHHSVKQDFSGRAFTKSLTTPIWNYLVGHIKPVPGARLVLSIFSEIRYDKRVT